MGWPNATSQAFIRENGLYPIVGCVYMRKSEPSSIAECTIRQLIAVYILGPLPESDAGNSYILIVVDYFTQWMEAYPIQVQLNCSQEITDFRFHLPSS